MAIFDRDTLCPLCGLALDDLDVVAFPPFVNDRADPLYPFHDAAVHRSCVDRHPLGARALAARSAATPGRDPALCVVCGQSIGRDERSFETGLLTSDPQRRASKYSFVAMHVAHFTLWDEREEFCAAVSEVVSSSTWMGPDFTCDPEPRWFRSETEDEHAARKSRLLRISRRGQDS